MHTTIDSTLLAKNKRLAHGRRKRRSCSSKDSKKLALRGSGAYFQSRFRAVLAINALACTFSSPLASFFLKILKTHQIVSYRLLVSKGEVKDSSYFVGEDGKLHHNNLAGGDKSKATRKEVRQPPKKKFKAQVMKKTKTSKRADRSTFPTSSKNRRVAPSHKPSSKSTSQQPTIRPSSASSVLAPFQPLNEEPALFPIVQVVYNSDEIDEVDLCANCGSRGDTALLLTCIDCGESYHWFCMEPPLARLNPEHKLAWRCAKCKICEICTKDTDEDQILVCDICDSGYHTFCLKPPLASIPMGEWICSSCVRCKSCQKTGLRNYTQLRSVHDKLIVLCLPCAKQYKKGCYCPICDKTYYEEDTDPPMVLCDSCHKWVHSKCEEGMDKVYSIIGETDEEYRCPPCRGWSPLSLVEKLSAQLESNTTNTEDQESAADLQTDGTRTHVNICRMIESSKDKQEDSSEEEEEGEDAFDIDGPTEADKAIVLSSSTSSSQSLKVGEWKCVLCDCVGDTEQEGRLLPMQYNLWVHVNCALWSSDVLMAIDGALIGLPRVVRSARNTICPFCKKKGATVRCMASGCGKSYHFRCAREVGFVFFDNSLLYCLDHAPEMEQFLKQKAIQTKCAPPAPLSSFQANRRLYITHTKANAPKPKTSLDATIAATISNTGDLKYTVRVGSIIIRSLGKVVYDNPRFHDADCIYPLGLRLAFRFPSTTSSNTTNEMTHCNATYVFDITEEAEKPQFRIQRASFYPNDPWAIVSFSLSTAWNELKNRKLQQSWEGSVNDVEQAHNRLNGSQSSHNVGSDSEESDSEGRDEDEISEDNDEMKNAVLYEIGLTRPWVKKMIESLPFAYRCVNYRFRFVHPTKEQLERNSM
eukprot:TRINITY_DN748_c0_g1_i2.p1 TRINITY_DN748_c0_g1~~TRINITY_DN748_c0_g1_i2.p1  ORF type:complete len:869 (+),score=108.90 TRINITY_DN748_c0_g1_i2:381-2987(+)